MRRGWLIYDEADIARNRAFIDYWLEAAAARDIALALVRSETLLCGIFDGRAAVLREGRAQQPDFAVMRAKRLLLSRQLEAQGVPVFNNALTSETLNDKRRTHALFAAVAPMLDTAFLTGARPSPFPFPVVVKGAGGCGGRQVRLCADEAQYDEALRAFDGQAVVQPVCDEPGRDLRIYMLGDRVVQAMLRFSDGEDIRSNFGLHHQARPVEAPPEQLAVAHAVARRLDSALIGVDFIRHGGRWLFNEAEDAVGTRMLYQYTKIDIVAEYLDYILSRLA